MKDNLIGIIQSTKQVQIAKQQDERNRTLSAHTNNCAPFKGKHVLWCNENEPSIPQREKDL